VGARLAGAFGLAASGPVAVGRRHAQNSAGLIGYALRGSSNLARPGLMLYGSSPLPDFQRRLRPALTLKTRVTLVRALPAGRGISYGRTFITPRAMRAGTLGAGYADGYPRHLSNAGAEVLVRGRRCPVLGRVTMDQIVVDLSDIPGAVEAGEEAVLIGAQGEEEILAGELAAKAGTIPWEIFTGLTARVGRYYLGSIAVAD
jgi:alanine racemase